MPEEYLDVACINHDKLVLHGRIAAGRDAQGFHRLVEIEQVLTDDQATVMRDLSSRHDQEMEQLLASFVDRSAYQ